MHSRGTGAGNRHWSGTPCISSTCTAESTLTTADACIKCKSLHTLLQVLLLPIFPQHSLWKSLPEPLGLSTLSLPQCIHSFITVFTGMDRWEDSCCLHPCCSHRRGRLLSSVGELNDSKLMWETLQKCVFTVRCATKWSRGKCVYFKPVWGLLRLTSITPKIR